LEALPSLFRVCLIGPECTGKTETAKRLAGHFGTVWVPEFAREYAEGVGRELTYADVEAIGRGQIANEDRISPNASSILILDTDLISTWVYSNAYYGAAPEWIEPEARRRRADLYLLTDIDIAFEPDDARAADEHRPAHLIAFREALAHFGAKWELISGVGELRVERAVTAIERANAAIR
jgi:HTH-type transcriptional repressor of NAD biosynthesis genes